MNVLAAETLPWLESERGQLRGALAAGRLPHSLLIVSNPGLGAEALAEWIAGLALCESEQRPCGRCASCRLLAADTHPDFHLVRVEEDAQQIKVDQVRALIESLALKSYRGAYKIGIIEGAELLNANGANAFLKTLEEPTQDTVLILVARPSHRLPATIASRCLRMTLKPPPASTAIAWLERHAPAAQAPPAADAAGAARPRRRPEAGRGKVAQPWSAALALAGGAPLLAAELAGSGIAELDRDMRESLELLAGGAVDATLLAERWLRTQPALRITWLENWITRRVHAALGGADSQQSAEPVRLPAALLKAKIRCLFELLDGLRDLRRLGSTGVNQQLALEALLLGGRGAFTN